MMGNGVNFSKTNNLTTKTFYSSRWIYIWL